MQVFAIKLKYQTRTSDSIRSDSIPPDVYMDLKL